MSWNLSLGACVDVMGGKLLEIGELCDVLGWGFWAPGLDSRCAPTVG